MGGLEKVVVELCETMDKNVVNPSVVCLDRIGVLGSELMKKNIRVDLLKRNGALDLSLMKRLREYFSMNSIDIVHSHSGCMLYSAFAGKLSKAKAVIHTDHGRHFPERWVVVVEELISSFIVNKIIAVSEGLKNYLIRKLHFPVKKIDIIPNGIDTAEFFAPAWKDEAVIIRKETGLNDDDYVIGTIGRLTPVKNQALLIRAFASVAKGHNKCKLIIVGDGPELNNLKKLTTDLNLSGKVLFLGERKDIPQILSIFDIFVLPSLSEGTSITLLEALSSSIPVIASNVGGNPKIIIDGETGLLFESRHTAELAEKIQMLISDPPKAEIFTRKGREKIIENFSVNEMNKRYILLYRHYV